MAVDSTHPIYDKYIKKWDKCRNVINGSDAVKESGEVYLPRLSGQLDTAYSAYKERALFFDGTKRTLEGLVGMLLRKDPLIEYPDLDDLDYVGSGSEDLYTFIKKIANEILTVGRCGILVDMPIEGEGQPCFFKYNAESVINWKTAKMDGIETLTMVVLSETYDENTDEFAIETKDRYRVLKLSEGIYTQEIYTKSDNIHTGKSEWVLTEIITPTQRGATLEFIPFIFVTVDGCSVEINNPPLLPLAETNLHHYRLSADYAHGLHYTALPTPVLMGFPADTEMFIGSETAWVSPETDAKVEYLEFQGTGLGALSLAIKETQDKMVILGARMLEQSKTHAETAESQQTKKSGENSILASVAEALGKVFTELLQIKREWEYGSLSADISVEINKDFEIQGIDANLLKTLTESWLAGAYSWETLMFNLKKGELLPEGFDIEVEKEKIINDGDMRGLGSLVAIDEE